MDWLNLIFSGFGVVLLGALMRWWWARRKPAAQVPTSAVFDGEQINNIIRGNIDTDADYVHRGRGEGNRWLGKIKQRRSR